MLNKRYNQKMVLITLDSDVMRRAFKLYTYTYCRDLLDAYKNRIG